MRYLGIEVDDALELAEQTDVPVFTAFPLSSPSIGVSLEVTSSSSKNIGFKITLPGVSGGFSGSSTTSFVLSHPANSNAIQYQQEMEAEIITWKNHATGHEIESYSFKKLSADRIAYDDSTTGNGYIACHVANNRSVVLKETTIQPNSAIPSIPLTIGIKKNNSEALNFDATDLVPGINLDIETETEDGFEVSYDAVPGYKYRLWGSRQDTHFVSPDATKV